MGNKKILLVDDEEANRVIALAFLRELFCEVEVAKNGQSAIEKFQSAQDAKQPYDLILMDMLMPRMNGAKVTQEIRRIEKNYRCECTLIVALTASIDPDEAMGAGCDYVLLKPIKKHNFIDTLKRVLKGEKI